jgi:AcrR family transcriptional regulator
MGAKERRERERYDARNKILAAAREMFEKKGYEAVTMRAIADRVEYTPTALYHHFSSKHALLAELCAADFARLGRQMLKTSTPTGPIERLRVAAQTYLRFAEQHPSQYRFLFMTVFPPFTEEAFRPHHQFDDPEQDAYAYLRRTCADAIAERLLRPEYDDPDALAQMLWGSVHGHISLRMAKNYQEFVPWKPLRSMVMTTLDTMLRGMMVVPHARQDSRTLRSTI